MKIDSFTLRVLENFACINTAVWINDGNLLETVSPTRAIVARVNVDTTFPKTFGLYRLNQFIQTLNLYNEPEVTFEDTHLLVSAGERSTKLAYGDPTLFEQCQVPPTLKFPSSDIKAFISSVVLRDLDKAVRVLGVEDLVLEGNGKTLMITARNMNTTAGSNYHTIVLGDTDRTFKAVVKHANMMLLPEDYDVEIAADALSPTGKKMPSLKFTANRIQYLVALDESSEF